MSEDFFLGEVALLQDGEPEEDFGSFMRLPYIETVHGLAREFSDHLELMPYQQLGDKKTLSLSVYLRPRIGDGRIIAILSREDYPKEKEAIAETIKVGIERLDVLRRSVGNQFLESSLDSARDSLHRLLLKASSL